MRRSKVMKQMRKQRGFTLTEILVSVLIMGIVMSAVLTLFFSVFKSYEFHQDIMEAKQRGQIALAAIEPVILNAGLGLSPESKDFAEYFAGMLKILPTVDDEKFTVPVQIAGDGKRKTTPETAGIHMSKYAGNELWLVYSVPSGYGVSSPDIEQFVGGTIRTVLIDPTDFASLKNNLTDGSTPAVQNNDLKSWVSFPGSSFPFVVKSDPQGLNSTNRGLQLESRKTQAVHLYDELHYVRAAKISASAGSLYVEYLTGGGKQPVVEGIRDMLCVYDPDGSRTLTVTVLARADTRRPELNIVSVEGWTGPIPDNKYRYAAVSKSWRMRN